MYAMKKGKQELAQVHINPVRKHEAESDEAEQSSGQAMMINDVLDRFVAGVRKKRANDSFLRMQKNGALLRDNFFTSTEFKSTLLAMVLISYGAERDLKKQADDNFTSSTLALNLKERRFFQRFLKQDFYLTHATNANLLSASGDLNIYSRKRLMEKRVLFPADNSSDMDVRGLGNDDYVFFSLEVGVPLSKTDSRFGTTLHKINFSQENFRHASLCLFDQLELTVPQPKIDKLSNEGKSILSKRPEPERLSIFFNGRDESLKGLAYNIIKLARMLPEQDQDVLLSADQPAQMNKLINYLFRPEVRVPRMVGIKSGDFYTFKLSPAGNGGGWLGGIYKMLTGLGSTPPP